MSHHKCPRCPHPVLALVKIAPPDALRDRKRLVALASQYAPELAQLRALVRLPPRGES